MAHDPAKKPTQAPKHKPSTKHTLHEVLNSLQDVLNNELADESDAPTARSNQSPNVLHSRSRDEVLSSLKALIGAAAAGEPLPSPDSQSPAAAAGLSEIGEDLKAPGGAEVPDSTDPEPVIDPEDAVAPAEEFHLEMEDPVSTPDVRETDPAPARETAPTRGKRKRIKPRQIEIGWDDIPVLNDVVAPAPEELDVEITPEIRDIAIKVAAALNIELKRAGKETLDVKMVMQLQSSLQRELAARGLPQQDTAPSEDDKKD
jgi:hypothetical protein